MALPGPAISLSLPEPNCSASGVGSARTLNVVTPSCSIRRFLKPPRKRFRILLLHRFKSSTLFYVRVANRLALESFAHSSVSPRWFKLTPRLDKLAGRYSKFLADTPKDYLRASSNGGTSLQPGSGRSEVTSFGRSALKLPPHSKFAAFATQTLDWLTRSKPRTL